MEVSCIGVVTEGIKVFHTPQSSSWSRLVGVFVPTILPSTACPHPHTPTAVPPSHSNRIRRWKLLARQTSERMSERETDSNGGGLACVRECMRECDDGALGEDAHSRVLSGDRPHNSFEAVVPGDTKHQGESVCVSVFHHVLSYSI